MLRRDAQQFKGLEKAVIGRPIRARQTAISDQFAEDMKRLGVTFTPKQPSLVHLRQRPAKDIIRKHASSPERIRESIRSVGGTAVLSAITVSRSTLELVPVTATDTTRTFMLSAFPIRAYTTSGKKVNLHDEQYALSCALGDFYADDPELWLGKIEGPARTDGVEDFLDILEDRFPTTLALGKVGIILAGQ